MQRLIARVLCLLPLLTNSIHAEEPLLPPENDDYSERRELQGGSVVFNGSVRGATAEGTDPVWPSGWNSGSVWWTWRAPWTGFAVMKVEGATGASLAVPDLRIFEEMGEPPNSLGVAVGGMQGRPGYYTGFGVAEGQSYSIGLAGDSNSESVLELSLRASESPIILEQPQSQTVRPGETATFRVVAPPLVGNNFQWQFNGVNISNATTTILIVPNVSAAQAGEYRVIVNTNGLIPTVTTTSVPALLALDGVDIQPVISLRRVAGDPNPLKAGLSGAELNHSYTIWISSEPRNFAREIDMPWQFERLLTTGKEIIIPTENLPNPVFFRAYRMGDLRLSCVANLQALVMGKSIWAMRNFKPPGAAIHESEVLDILGGRPVCMMGGVYTLGGVGTTPTCSIQGHTLQAK